MNATQRLTDMQSLCADIDACQREAFRLGLQVTGHALNNAKNASGWEMTGDIENAAKASKGIRPGETAP